MSPLNLKSAGLLLLAPLLLTAAPSSRWTVFETARDNGHRLAMLAAPAAGAVTPGVLTVDPAQKYQEMVGFGGALTESSAWVLAQLPSEKRAEVLRRYYDPTEGIGYTLARTHINSCDFSLSMWALDETPGDYDLHHFTLEPMRRWLMPLLRDAQKVAGQDRFKLLASPWSPPAWMKTNNRMDDGGSLRGEYAPAWANYFVKFVQRMKAEENIGVWALTVQNEPQAKQVWESCLYTPEQERDFVKKHLGPALAGAGLSGVKLLALDHNRDLIEAHAGASLGDPGSAKYLWGMGLHWYVSSDFAASSRVHAKYPDKPILFTEGCWEGGDKIGAWEHGEGYAQQMIGDFKNWVTGYIDWNIVLDQRGGPNHVGNFCDAPVIVDTNTKEVRYGPSFYYIAHFSKFVRPGAQRIASSGDPAGLDSIAFANPDGSLAVVVLNRTDAAVTFTLAVGGEALACTVPAHAVQTYLRHRP
ncbi:MAG: glycoside hydrolase family 30 protein [Opitutae bacterium]|nr:glycoside hydrolase family 30 protein [Opitutae bacterium]